MKKEILISLFLLTIFCVGNTFAQNEKKVAYGVLLDNTVTLRYQLGDVKNVGKEIVKQISQRGVISLFTFGTTTFTTKKMTQGQVADMRVSVDWTQDKEYLNRHIENTFTVTGITALLDTIRSSAEKINSKVNSEKDNFSEKILILVTDGEDRDSLIKPEELIKFLKDSSIKVYAIGLLEGFGKDRDYLFPGKNPKAKAKKFLEKITKETSGRVVFPKEKQTFEDVVKDLLTENIKESK